MTNEILSYGEMCQREGVNTLQRGMNFRLHPAHSVVLMSLRRNAPYVDHVADGGTTLTYAGHDTPRRLGGPDPKTLDQPFVLPGGTLTQNGRFFEAAKRALDGEPSERVHVYEKVADGIWSFNGVFQLVDAWQERQDGRLVFKFRLHLVDGANDAPAIAPTSISRGRLIPSAVKLEVWRRDRGACVQCGKSDDLHFDHVLPFSKGGTSVAADNVQLLCARHNLEKSAKIV